MIQLRDYQERWIAGLRAAFASGEWSVLGVLPTGAGKTVCFSYLTWKLVENSKRVVIMAHREELLDQISRTLTQFGVRHGMISAGSIYDRRLLAHVASVQTLAKRLDRVQVPDYVIVDEAHHAILASLYGKIIAYWRALNPNLRVIGVTATPERLSGEGLGETFGYMVLGPTPRELIELGALCEYRLFAPKVSVDLSGVSVRAGDYAKGELGAALDKPAIIGSAVGEYRKLCDGLPAVTFCVSIEHAAHTAEQFRAAGYRAASIDGKMDKALRRQIVSDFGRGALNVLTSAEIVSEGFDIPGITAAILLRPTHSLALYLQQVGRALRPAPGKDAAIILDHVLNSSRHGLPDDPREWSLIGGGGKKKSSAEAEGRQCAIYEAQTDGTINGKRYRAGDMIGGCYAVSAASAAKCRECGTPFPVKARVIEEVDGALSEVEVARMRRQAARDQAAAKTLDDLIALGTSRGMKNPAGWARHVHAAREAKQRAG